MRGTGAERPVVAGKSGRPDGAKGSRHSARSEGQPPEREESSSRAKSFCISKKVVWEAYKRVKAKKGAAGSGSLFVGLDSPVGPVYLAYGHAEGGNDSVYLFLGQPF